MQITCKADTSVTSPDNKGVLSSQGQECAEESYNKYGMPLYRNILKYLFL